MSDRIIWFQNSNWNSQTWDHGQQFYCVETKCVEEVIHPFTYNDNGDTLVFSPGLLQYNAAQNHWRLASSQFETVGDANRFKSSTLDAYIDLFTFPVKSGNTPVDPWYMGGNYQSNVDTVRDTEFDFGTKVEGGWVMPSGDEMDYLLLRRDNWSNLLAKARVSGRNGYLVLPDDWTRFDELDFSRTDWYDNQLTLEQWVSLEGDGAVFIPCSGMMAMNSGIVTDNNTHIYLMCCTTVNVALYNGISDSQTPVPRSASTYNAQANAVRLIRHLN